MTDFSSIWLDIECPKCGYLETARLIDFKCEVIIICHNCKSEIQLIDDEASVFSTVAQFDQAIKDFSNTFKNFNK